MGDDRRMPQRATGRGRARRPVLRAVVALVAAGGPAPRRHHPVMHGAPPGTTLTLPSFSLTPPRAPSPPRDHTPTPPPLPPPRHYRRVIKGALHAWV